MACYTLEIPDGLWKRVLTLRAGIDPQAKENDDQAEVFHGVPPRKAYLARRSGDGFGTLMTGKIRTTAL